MACTMNLQADPVNTKNTRAEIVDAADRLFYRQGYDHTSFADIAGAVKISRGNFYHHFKTKDAILDSVIDVRLDNTRRMLDAWEAETDDPAGRIRCYIQILIRNRDKIMRYGCPVGTLSTELAKLNHTGKDDARQIFTLFRDWLAAQFRALGFAAESDRMALHVLSFSQGVATLANAYDDEDFIRDEVDRMCAWLDACIAAGKYI